MNVHLSRIRLHLALLICTLVTVSSQSQELVINVSTPFNDSIELSARQYDYVLNKSSFLYRHPLNRDGSLKFSLNSTNPRKIAIGNSEVFLEGAGEVFLTIDSTFKIIKAKAKYPGNFTFLSSLPEQPNIGEIADAFAWKVAWQKQRDERLLTVESARKQNSISESFNNFLKADFTGRYLSILYSYYNRNKDSFGLKPSFIDELNQKHFADSKNLNSMWYGFAIDDFTTHISNAGRVFTPANFELKANAIKQHFNGKQREYLLAYLFRRYCVKQNAEYANVINKYYKELAETVKDPLYLETINLFYSYYTKANKPLPNEIMQLPLRMNNESTTLRSVLENGKPNKILAFWASWCGPCIAEIKELGVKYPGYVSDNYEFVFISIDENAASFNSMANKLNIKSYSAIDNLPAFINFFELQAIPRDVLYRRPIIADFDFDLQKIY